MSYMGYFYRGDAIMLKKQFVNETETRSLFSGLTKKMKIHPNPIVMAIIVLLVPSGIWAACSGSGLTWTCTSGSSSAQVQTAVNSCSDEGTITFLNGSYSLSGVELSQRNGITLICESIGGCNLTATGDTFTISYIPTTKTNLIRISGFKFTANSGTAKIWFYGNNNINKIRIDHNSFSGLSTGYIAILMGSTDTAGRMYGVIDNNSFTGSTNHMALKMLSGGDTWVTGLQGSVNNMFFEDNTVNFSANNDLGSGAVDAWMANGIVVRHNTISGSRLVNHSLCHGGPINSEVYNNTISDNVSNPANYRNVHWQGSGEIIAFNNTIAGGHMALQHYRSDASQMPQGDCTASTVCNGSDSRDGNRSGQYGYPCWHQPGRNANGILRPVYLWNNKDTTGAKVDVSLESGGYMETYHFLANRDYYQAASITAQTSKTSPFDGTSGVGFGTLANRPDTCTTGSVAADAGYGGVGYFATDSGGQGTLYRCSATNTWSVHYQPYQYPHPLRIGGVGGGGGDTQLNAPSGLKVIQ
jgi:hypothetical protein